MLFIIIFLWALNISYSNNSRINEFNNISESSKEFKELTKEKELWKATENIWFKIIDWIRYIFTWVLIILIIYAWIQMILSQWTDDDQLSKAKRSIWYAIVWMIFINFPMEIYKWLVSDRGWWIITIVNIDIFKNIVKNILTAIEIVIAWIAIFILVYEWIKLIVNSRKEEEAIKNAKQKIIRIIIALISIWFIEIWILFLKTWDIENSTSIFQSIANLALYAAWPIAIFFIALAWYYYIFSNWDDEKVKKWKNIIINTSIWIIILLCIYVLLNDISLLNFN